MLMHTIAISHILDFILMFPPPQLVDNCIKYKINNISPPDFCQSTVFLKKGQVIACRPLVELHIEAEWGHDLGPHKVNFYYQEVAQGAVGIYPMCYVEGCTLH